jgi:hypothetical protein
MRLPGVIVSVERMEYEQISRTLRGLLFARMSACCRGT